MSLHKVIDIVEADYGCEECPSDGPHALLVLDSDKKVEVSEKWITDHGIKTGKHIWINTDGSVMKAIRVVAAIIQKNITKPDGNKMIKIFSTQRGYGEFKDGWEFPGGKEELDTTIEVDKYLDTIEYNYPEFHLSMDCFLCNIISGELNLKEHEAAKWLSKDELDSVDWLPADITIIEKVRELM